MASIALPRLHRGLTLHRRLQLAFGVLSLLVLALAITAPLAINYLQSAAREAIQVDGHLSRLATDVAIKIQIARRYDQSYFLHLENRHLRDEYVQLWSLAAEDVNEAITAFAAAATAETDRRQAQLWLVHFDVYQRGFRGITIAVSEGQIQTPQQAIRRFADYQPNIQFLADLTIKTARDKAARAEQAALRVAQTGRLIEVALALTGLIAVILALVWSLSLPYSLTRPVDHLNRAVQDMASGNLSARTGLMSEDELGRLGQAFDQMAEIIAQRTAELQTQIAAAEAARREAEEAHAQAAKQLAIIAAQQEIIRELSIPVLPVSDRVLVMPLIGALDSGRLAQAQERALQALERERALYLILDVTGVPTVDSHVASGLIQIVRAARLLGAQAILVGIRPDVAQSLVALGIDLSAITTYATLQSGIHATLTETARRKDRPVRAI